MWSKKNSKFLIEFYVEKENFKNNNGEWVGKYEEKREKISTQHTCHKYLQILVEGSKRLGLIYLPTNGNRKILLVAKQ